MDYRSSRGLCLHLWGRNQLPRSRHMLISASRIQAWSSRCRVRASRALSLTRWCSSNLHRRPVATWKAWTGEETWSPRPHRLTSLSETSWWSMRAFKLTSRQGLKAILQSLSLISLPLLPEETLFRSYRRVLAQACSSLHRVYSRWQRRFKVDLRMNATLLNRRIDIRGPCSRSHQMA